MATPLITKAFYDQMANDSILTGMIGSLRGRPCIFTDGPIPGDAPMPLIVSIGEISHEPFDTKTDLGREIRRDIACYAKATGSAVTIEAIAERIRFLFHRVALSIPNLSTILCVTTGPIVAPTDETVVGRILTVRYVGQEV